jgi:hypothetical protein
MEALYKSVTKKPSRFAGCVENLQQMLKFPLMGYRGVDDESEYFPAIKEEPADNDLDADFDDDSDGDKKPPPQPSSNQHPR